MERPPHHWLTKSPFRLDRILSGFPGFGAGTAAGLGSADIGNVARIRGRYGSHTGMFTEMAVTSLSEAIGDNV